MDVKTVYMYVPLKLYFVECIIKGRFAGCIITDVDLLVITHKFGEKVRPAVCTQSHTVIKTSECIDRQHL